VERAVVEETRAEVIREREWWRWSRRLAVGGEGVGAGVIDAEIRVLVKVEVEVEVEREEFSTGAKAAHKFGCRSAITVSRVLILIIISLLLLQDPSFPLSLSLSR